MAGQCVERGTDVVAGDVGTVGPDHDGSPASVGQRVADRAMHAMAQPAAALVDVP